jgi:hypothetical protein
MSITKILTSASSPSLLKETSTHANASDLATRVDAVATSNMNLYVEFINWAEKLTLQIKEFYQCIWPACLLKDLLQELDPAELQTLEDLDKEPLLSLKGKIIDLLLDIDEIDPLKRTQIQTACSCSLAVCEKIFDKTEQLSSQKRGMFGEVQAYALSQRLREIKAFRQAIQLLHVISNPENKETIAQK